MQRHAILIALFLASAVSLSAESKPVLRFSPAAWDIGALLYGTRARIVVAVTNEAGAEATVSFMPTCTCLAVEPSSQAIAPGATARFTLHYDSKDVVSRGRKVVADRKSFIVRSGLPGDSAPYYYFPTASVHFKASDETATRPWIRGAGRDAIVTLSYWYDPECRECEEFLGTMIPALEHELGIGIEMLLLDARDPLLYEEASGLFPARSKYLPPFPVLKAGFTLLQGDSQIRAELKDILKAAVP